MNPFRDTIVSSPWAACVDVPEIQSDVFQECLQGIHQVRTSGRSASLLIHGAAGAGKTHLLSRLRTHLTLQAPSATDRDECLFVWVRLQASPRMIWRHVRRTLVEDWFRPVRGQRSQFERILFHRLADIRVATGDLEPWYEYMLDTDPTALDQLLDDVAESLFLDRNTTIAFKHIAFGRHRRDLRAWLGGDSLPEEALARLSLSQDEGTDEDREHEARRVVLMLCKLAGDGLPIVLSLDQVEALQTSVGDRDGLFAFGQLVSTLHDETSNVFVIPCVQSSFATELKDKSRGADYDRMTSLGARSLATLTRSQAEKLIAARLSLAGPGFMPPPTTDALWPLDPTDFPRLAAVNELTPRRLLATCADRFEVYVKQASSSAVIDVPPDDQPATDAEVIESSADSFLDDEWKSRVEQALSASRPERTEEIVRHGLPQLARLLSPHWKPVRDEQLPDIPLVFEEPSGVRTGVSICTQANMNSVTALLKRLKTQFTPDRLGRLIVLRDGRVPLSKTAKVASQSLEQLVQQGAVIAEHSAEVYAALDALRELISESKSGDLSRDGQTVLPDTVEKWLCQHLPVGLRDFVDSILGKSSSADDSLPLESLATLLSERPIVPLAEAAVALNSTEATVVALIQRHPDRARLLMGPPAVVFRVDGDSLS
ncbi:MAG: hypothetical protein JSS49_00300 [Planctomycetes bacterium]|nr:hypothetical protein [Planctomycetota bacterium]